MQERGPPTSPMRSSRAARRRWTAPPHSPITAIRSPRQGPRAPRSGIAGFNWMGDRAIVRSAPIDAGGERVIGDTRRNGHRSCACDFPGRATAEGYKKARKSWIRCLPVMAARLDDSLAEYRGATDDEIVSLSHVLLPAALRQSIWGTRNVIIGADHARSPLRHRHLPLHRHRGQYRALGAGP
jgi:hypothetical protein